MYLIEAYVTNPSFNVDHPFTYLSDEAIERYTRISVSFNNSPNVALVVGCSHTARSKEELEEGSGFAYLPVLEIIDEKPIISQEQFELAEWLAKTTVSPFISCLNAMLPKALRTSKSFSDPKKVRLIHKHEARSELSKRQKEVYDSLHEGMAYGDALKLSAYIVRRFLNDGTISEYLAEAEYRNVLTEKDEFKTLTDDQQLVYDRILASGKSVSLLFGVTGSGKTEVYLHLARHYLSLGKEVLILVPEIALTPQMIERVKSRFDDVIFYHSELSDQERYEQYKRVKQGEVKIVVGTRSAVFLPFRDLGMIIVDEEHDSSYKQDNTPCYQAKNVAIRRALTHHGKVLLASATPSLESYSRARTGEYELLELKDRINLNLPRISIVDLNEQIKKHRSYIISDELSQKIGETLSRNKQAIILLNRRGYSPIVRCADCNKTLMCNDCDCALNYHSDIRKLKCHQCSRVYEVPKTCPSCGSKDLIYYGFGTMKVEEELHKLFPEAKLARMDRDNVARKGSHEKILKAFERKQTDILIGTQMIAKGLDYPDVTLVGILNADAGLAHQDFNSAKVTFDLLMQASGRSGRADDAGEVVIQAFNTGHYAIRAVMNQDYNYFYNIEMNYRYKASYPPYTHFTAIILSDMNKERLDRSVGYVEDRLSATDIRSYRPYELPRIQGQHRCRILLSGKSIREILDLLHGLIDDYLDQKNLSRIKIDVDPLYLE